MNLQNERNIEFRKVNMNPKLVQFYNQPNPVETKKTQFHKYKTKKLSEIDMENMNKDFDANYYQRFTNNLLKEMNFSPIMKTKRRKNGKKSAANVVSFKIGTTQSKQLSNSKSNHAKKRTTTKDLYKESHFCDTPVNHVKSDKFKLNQKNNAQGNKLLFSSINNLNDMNKISNFFSSAKNSNANSPSIVKGFKCEHSNENVLSMNLDNKISRDELIKQGNDLQDNYANDNENKIENEENIDNIENYPYGQNEENQKNKENQVKCDQNKNNQNLNQINIINENLKNIVIIKNSTFRNFLMKCLPFCVKQ